MEMKRNGVSVIHLAIGMLVGYPPCSRIRYFTEFIWEMYKMDVVVGTHPILENYLTTHTTLKTCDSKLRQELIAPALSDEGMRKGYD